LDLKAISEICGRHGTELLINTPVAPYTSFKIGGSCNIVKLNGTPVLTELLSFCKRNSIPRYVLGKGSNVLISDKGLPGIVLLMGESFSGIDIEDSKNGQPQHKIIVAQAGARLSDICKAAALHSLTGMEFAYGIPGTAGGALYMNAGAYGGEMAHVVESCSYIDTDSGRLCCCNADDMKLSYRHSIFSEQDWVITKVKFRLKYGDKLQIKSRMDEITAARKEKQPLDFPSAGSTFKRPPPTLQGEPVFAAKLIDDCGLKGRSIGGAAVSEKHAGFVINKGNATFDDVAALIELIQQEVHSQTGVMLEREVKTWSF